MLKSIHYTAFLTIICGLSAIHYQSLAQDRKEATKGTYIDSTNRYYQQASLPVYIYIGTSPETKDGVRLNPSTKTNSQAMYLDGHGRHYIRHKDPKHGDVTFEINGDGKAPISMIKFNKAPSHTKNGRLFFGKDLTFEILSKDEMSGLATVYQSINRTDYIESKGKTPLDTEQEYFIQYYGTDKVGNAEATRNKTFTVDLTPPQTNHTIKGDQTENIISGRSLVTLFATDELSGVNKISYRLHDDEPYKPYAGALSFAALGDGEHTLYYKATDNVKNTEDENAFTFYLDKMPPIITPEILGDRYVFQGKTFFSGRTKLELHAIDNKAGVREIYYSVDGASYQKYEKPFYIPNRTGHHIVNYYAIDNVNNKGSGKYERTVTTMFMDLTGPRLAFNYQGTKFVMNNHVYLSPQTKIILHGTDPESGMQNIDYELDGTGTLLYEKPFVITSEGQHHIKYTGTDNVNNTNQDEFDVIVDASAPEIFMHFSLQPIAEDNKGVLAASPQSGDVASNNLPIYPSHLAVYLAATDNMVGTEKIFYSINGGAEQLYQTPISNFPTSKITTLKVRAVDKLGNSSTQSTQFLIEK
jgi:hypothetical protein